jgi:crooked neck
LETNLKNYDTWFDYGKLEESTGDVDRVREVYERAIAQVPPAQEKRLWRRYIYLWIKYALFEELETHVSALALEQDSVSYENHTRIMTKLTN